VRWIADRTESMLSDNGARDLEHDVEMGFDADNRLIAYHVKTRYNLGAYNSNFGQAIQTFLFARVVTGVYDIQDVFLEAEGYYTNTAQTDAYRGAGRPEAIFLLERSMDLAARELGVDPWELRRKNFIPRDQLLGRELRRRRFQQGARHGGREGGPVGLCRAAREERGGGQAARLGTLLLHRIYPRRSERGRGGRVHRGGHREHLRRHPVERAGA
jgi:CO/xanthine dehydrogenase Mo-binding subunit